jgi:predicted ATPase
MTKIYDIGPFRLDSEVGVLTKAGVPMALGSRAVAVLVTLVERPNEYVPKASIMDTAWPGVVVEESNLAVQISAIRRVLAQVPGGDHWVETLARRGYRFVGPVTELQEDVRREQIGSIQRSNLPEPLTSFIGRERELVEIKRLLPGARLLTLVGVGGIGKTRLALQAAAEVLDAYRDGAWLVEFGAIANPLLVPTSVAQVLGVQERPGAPLTQQLCAHLKARELLLILDNCEHLLDACARLADAVLRSAADTTIIATSREPLDVAGEQTYPLQTLSLPEPSASAEAVGRSEAVQLFVERARRQLPDFELTAARAPAVAQLCIHLDGIPLALELAAARIRSLSIEQINARLHDRFKLLTGGNRMALPRQHTLRATLDWSYDLLAEDERTVLRRLAIFPGSFTLEAASSVASDGVIDEFAVIDLLSQLVGRSLVVADTNEGGTRYRLLETMRAYALEKLAEVEETDAIKRRHAQYFRRLFERAPEEWLRMSDVEWRAIYVPELDNVRAALDWARGSGGDPAISTALTGVTGAVWMELSLQSEGRQRLQEAAANVGTQTPASDRARLWFWQGLLWDRAEPTQAVPAMERAIELYRRLDDALVLGYLLARLGNNLAIMGRYEQAAPALAEALPLLERAGVPKALGYCYEALGVLKETSDLKAAQRHYEKALSLYRGAGAKQNAVEILGSLVDTKWALGDLDGALADARETVALLRKSPLTTKGKLGINLVNLAGVLTERGELDEALAAAREGVPLLKEGGYAWITMDHVALRTALAGSAANAARLAGFSDSTHAAKEALRQPNEARAHARLRALLREKLAADELERLLAEGEKMSEDEACRLALED